jgi:hypothetical protein
MTCNKYCVVGPQDLTMDEFFRHFQPFLDAAIDEGASFVVGDESIGTDLRTRNYLFMSGCANIMTVYYVSGRKHPYIALSGERLVACRDDEDRDRCMCRESNRDIHWMRKSVLSSPAARTRIEEKKTVPKTWNGSPVERAERITVYRKNKDSFLAYLFNFLIRRIMPRNSAPSHTNWNKCVAAYLKKYRLSLSDLLADKKRYARVKNLYCKTKGQPQTFRFFCLMTTYIKLLFT